MVTLVAVNPLSTLQFAAVHLHLPFEAIQLWFVVNSAGTNGTHVKITQQASELTVSGLHSEPCHAQR